MEEVEAEVIEPAGIQVSYSPAVISDNVASVSAWVDGILETYEGTEIDPADDGQVKAARKMMADLNALKKQVEDERKRIKREYEKPLREFEGRVRPITERIDGVRGSIKEQVDKADDEFRAMRTADLEEEYEGMAGDVAKLIPLESFMVSEWLRRSVSDEAAKRAMVDKAVEIVQGYESLKAIDLAHRDEVMKRYCETGSTREALELEGELKQKDMRLKAFSDMRRMVEGNGGEPAVFEAVADAPAEAPQENEEAKPNPADEVHLWEMSAQFTATRRYAAQIGIELKQRYGMSGKFRDKGEVNNG